MTTVLTPADELDYLREAAWAMGVGVPAFVLPEDRHVVLRELRLHYLDWGMPGKRPFLFLHGGALNAHSWDLVCLALRGDYHCIALDLRGHGDSEWSPVGDYALDRHIADVEALVEHLDLRDFVLAGMSLGGLAAIGYAAAHADRLHALVIVDVAPDVQRAGSQRVREFVRDDEFESIDAFVQQAGRFNPRRSPASLRRSLHYNLRQTPRGTWVWKHDRRRHGDDHEWEEMLARHRRLWEIVPDITCPALVVRGADSDVITDHDAGRLAAALPNGQRTTVPRAGHSVQGDNPADLIAAIRDFMANIERASPDEAGW
jgi:esterase